MTPPVPHVIEQHPFACSSCHAGFPRLQVYTDGSFRCLCGNVRRISKTDLLGFRLSDAERVILKLRLRIIALEKLAGLDPSEDLAVPAPRAIPESEQNGGES